MNPDSVGYSVVEIPVNVLSIAAKFAVLVVMSATISYADQDLVMWLVVSFGLVYPYHNHCIHQFHPDSRQNFVEHNLRTIDSERLVGFWCDVYMEYPVDWYYLEMLIV